MGYQKKLNYIFKISEPNNGFSIGYHEQNDLGEEFAG